MNINIVCVGVTKEKLYKELYSEYIKRLQRFCNVTVTETASNTTINNPNKNQIINILNEEAKNYNKYLKGYLIVLDIDGKQMKSEEFSAFLSEKKTEGISQITFLIGSSYGISKEIKQKANYKLSFSKMTFPHKLFRVMLLEQIYRGFMIESNMTYHK